MLLSGHQSSQRTPCLFIGSPPHTHTAISSTMALRKGVTDVVRRQKERLRDGSWGGWEEWFERESAALDAPVGCGGRECGVSKQEEKCVCAPAWRRVLVVRHGMGYHNDLGGVTTIANRDAVLNEAGEEQARYLGELLTREEGEKRFSWNRVGLVVASPYRRTMQTCALALEAAPEEQRLRLEPILAQPLAGEHVRNLTSRGDRGSVRQDLESWDPSLCSRFDLDELDRYCHERQITNGKWYHHRGQDLGVETESSFMRRAVALRQWLGQLSAEKCAENEMVLLFSHGGILREAFAPGEAFSNCEMRVFDISSDGTFRRVARVNNSNLTNTNPFQRPTVESAHLVAYAQSCARASALALDLLHSEDTALMQELHTLHAELNAAGAALGLDSQPQEPAKRQKDTELPAVRRPVSDPVVSKGGARSPSPPQQQQRRSVPVETLVCKFGDACPYVAAKANDKRCKECHRPISGFGERTHCRGCGVSLCHRCMALGGPLAKRFIRINEKCSGGHDKVCVRCLEQFVGARTQTQKASDPDGA
jgi:broad specificity phosphatase PhoE